VIEYLQRCFGYALKQNKDNIAEKAVWEP